MFTIMMIVVYCNNPKIVYPFILPKLLSFVDYNIEK